MKRVILDENLPVRLRDHLVEFEVVTVQYQGWAGILNGELIQLIDGNFDVFVTGDKHLRYQQNLRNRTIAIIEVPSTDWRAILELLDKLKMAISKSAAGGYIQI
mgnify:CR=1 FL=1